MRDLPNQVFVPSTAFLQTSGIRASFRLDVFEGVLKHRLDPQLESLCDKAPAFLRQAGPDVVLNGQRSIAETLAVHL